MMVRSHAAERSFTPNGLLSGLGLTDAEITAALVAGAGPGTPAYEARYGAGGSYQREASVIATYGDTNADKVADVKYDPVTEQWSSTNPSYNTGGEAVYIAPALYPPEACSPMDSECVARNDLVAQANQVLRDNANRLVFMANCQTSGRGALCDQYKQVAVPPVPELYGSARQKLPAIDNRSVIVGETPAQQQATATAWEAQQKAMTAQQAASTVTGKPNQTVPPRAQPGEVATGGGITAAELAAILAAQNKQTATGPGFSLVDADGKILGLEPKVLMLIAAGVGALMLLKK